MEKKLDGVEEELKKVEQEVDRYETQKEALRNHIVEVENLLADLNEEKLYLKDLLMKKE